MRASVRALARLCLEPGMLVIILFCGRYVFIRWLIVCMPVSCCPLIMRDAALSVHHCRPFLLLARIHAGPRYVGKVATVATLIVFMTFLFFSPLVYGIALTNDGHERRRWLPRWN